jgi:hypothetical protein
MSVLLSTDFDSPTSIPYFLWDEPMTVTELRSKLASASNAERNRLLGKILREARDTDVWAFTEPKEVLRRWDEIEPYLGRRREFWKFILGQWQELGLIG